jgi:hypothetical protein
MFTHSEYLTLKKVVDSIDKQELSKSESHDLSQLLYKVHKNVTKEDR